MTTARLQSSFGQMPLYFIENRGQLDSQVAYYIQGRDTSLYFTKRGVRFSTTKGIGRDLEASLRRASRSDRESLAGQRWNIKLDFLGADPNVRITGREKTSALISYFKGPRDSWKTALPTYSSIVYADLWPGIDLVYSGSVNRLKYQFVVKPGASPASIRLAYRGARKVELDEFGRLAVETPTGAFQDDVPYSYQESGGRRVEVPTRYALEGHSGSPRVYGFHVSAYDKTKPLILDPAILVYAGYVGGSGDEQGFGIAVDGAGNAYITGRTASTEVTFPDTVGPDLTFNSGNDAFVAKVNAAGTALVYAGYIGGSEDDEGDGIAVDSAGNAYITGTTSSAETTFPVTIGPDLIYNGGLNDAFVAKVNAAGTALVYAGYIGGSEDDEGEGIAVNAGNAYITGTTSSAEATFPVTGGPDSSYNGGLTDAFVTKVNAAGTAFVYSGYIGGSSSEQGRGIAVDSAGNAYVTGLTSSTEATFPDTVGPDLTYNGGNDAFVTKINAAGTALVYAGYVGGSGSERGDGIAVDSSGDAYIMGVTASTEATFPVTVGPDLTYNGGSFDAFVAKVNAAGTALTYAGYIGGSGLDQGRGITVDGAGSACVTGHTDSTEATFPVTVGPDVTYNGVTDGFVARVNVAGTALTYAGYIGGSGDDFAFGIAVDSAGDAYVTGTTSSAEATFPVTGGPDLTHNGSRDAFVAKVSDLTSPTVSSITPDSGPASGGTDVTIAGTNFVTGASVTIGSVSATGVSVESSTRIDAMAPALLPGTLNDVTVTNPGSRSAAVSDPDASSATLAKGWLADFTDVPQAHLFHDFVEKLFRNGVTAGCGGGAFCINNPVTRAQMAVFLLKGKHGSGYAPPAATGTVFGDVSAAAFAAAFIEQLAAEGITGGCGGGNYCPNNSVTRGQMAVFLLKAKHGSAYTPPPATGVFNDVPAGHTLAPWIEQLFAEGITAGCGGGNFCAGNPVTRGQMAVFLVKAFSLP